MERFLLIMAVATSGVSCLNPYSETPRAPELRGIDITGYDYDMPNIEWAARDFALIQVTGGKNYFTSSWCAKPVDKLLDNGMLVGVYHVARDRSASSREQGTAQEEAEWFLEHSIMYRGLAIPILRWTDHRSHGDTHWAETWLDTVARKWGTIPWIQLWPETVEKDDWRSVANSYPLWLDESSVPEWKRPTKPSPTKHWKAPIAWRERKQSTGVSGSNFVGWDVFYGNRTDWLEHVRLGSSKAQEPSQQPCVATPPNRCCNINRPNVTETTTQVTTD